ncbi:MAG: endolytic transglycosylase MltG [Candidatus Berkiellales bacterium]
MIRGKQFFIFTALLICFMSVALFFWVFPRQPFSHDSDIAIYNLTKGTSAKAMLEQFKRRGILTARQAQLFRWWIQIQGLEKSLQVGEYAIPLNITPRVLLEKLIKGDVLQHVLTVQEGSTIRETLMIMHQHPAIKKCLVGKSLPEIMALLGEPSLFAEGVFFPDTYYFTADLTDLALLRRARQTMNQRLNTIWAQRDPNVVLHSSYEALILASIIEKETGLDQERHIISGVFQRRLAKHMRLQADPTVAYGLSDFSGILTKEHLKQESPYNTYLHGGLPPTPIALPSMKSIIAACHPDKGEALYFVAKGDGGHYFSNTLADHNKAVEYYRRGRAQ